jgi:hypothetical protein
MSMLDRLRERAIDDDDYIDEELESELLAGGADAQEKRFLGMTAVERMLLSIMVFMATTVLGTLLLIALGRIDIGL